MHNEDDAAPHESRDAHWPAQHRALDAALAAGIRGPVVDARFDRQVWARIGIEASAEAEAQRRRPAGMPLWLNALNAVAIGAAAFMLTLSLGTAARPMASSARAALAVIAQSPRSIGIAVFVASAVGLWLGLRQTSLARAVVRQWL